MLNIDEMQFAFEPGKGSTDAIFIVRQLREKYIAATNKWLYFASVDLEKAFNSVPRKVLCRALRSLEVDEWVVCVIQGMYHNAQSRVQVNGQYSESLAWELVGIRALSLAHCSSSYCWKHCRTSSTLVFDGSFSMLMTWCSSQTSRRSLFPSSRHGRLAWKVKGSMLTWRRPSSYTLGREYRVMRNRYSRLLFTSEDRICANLHVQEQSTNMTSQC